MSRYAFSRCANGDPAFFTREKMALYLDGKELGALCELMGIPTSGTKTEQIERLLTARELREILAPYQTPEGDRLTTEASIRELANRFKGKGLDILCRRAGCYAGSTKYAKAASLLQWRNACRHKGQKALKAAQERPRVGRPRQMSLTMEVTA